MYSGRKNTLIRQVKEMWELYDALIDSVASGEKIERAVSGRIWTAVETANLTGVAMTTEGESMIPMYPGGVEGLTLREAAVCAKSWNLVEAGFGMAAVNACCNTAGRMDELGCSEPYDNYCTRGLDFTGMTVGLVGHLKMPSGTLDAAKQVYILERHPKPGDYPDSACEYILPGCDAVLITGSSLVNKTLPRLLELCRDAYVILTGPTVPLCPALLDFGIDRIAGMCVTDRHGAWNHAAGGRDGPPFRYGRTFLLGRDLA